MSPLLRQRCEFGRVLLALVLRLRLTVLLSVMEPGWTTLELVGSSQTSKNFSGLRCHAVSLTHRF